MKPVIDYGFAEGMWSIADVAMHIEAAIAQHPDPVVRNQMHAEFKKFEANAIRACLPMLHEIDRAVENALEDT